MAKTVDYDKRFDSLFVHNGFASDEKFRGNVVVGDIVLDTSTKGRVVGVEVLNASRFFGKDGVGEDVLDNLSDVELSVSNEDDVIVMSLVFKTKSQKIPAKIAVPLALAA
jgi:uncharacterized protein YuzE